MDLGRSSRSLLPRARSGSSSTIDRRSERNASVRPSGEKRAWPSCRAPRVSWRGARPSVGGRDEPERVPVAVVARRHRLERDEHEPAVGREARLGRDAEAVQVVGAGRTGHGTSGRASAQDGGDAAKSTGLPSGHDVRPAVAAARDRPPAGPAGPPADAAAPAAGAVRLRRAPLRAVVGRVRRAGVHRPGRRAGRRRRPDRRRRRGGPVRGLPRAGRHGRPRRRAVGDPRRRAGRRRRRRAGGRRRRSRRGSPASAADRPRSSRSTCSHLDGRSLLGQPLVRGARRCGASCGPATRSWPCPPSRPRAGRSTTRPSPRASPGIMARQRMSPYLPGRSQPAVAVRGGHPGECRRRTGELDRRRRRGPAADRRGPGARADQPAAARRRGVGISRRGAPRR